MKRFVVSLVSLVVLSAGTAFAQVGYTFADLGTPNLLNPQNIHSILGGDINNSGDIVFYADSIGNIRSPQAYSIINGNMQALPQLLPNKPYTGASDINDSGQIVGASQIGYDANNPNTPTYAPVEWQGNSVTDLTSTGLSSALAINNAGHILGRDQIYANGQLTHLGIPNFFASALNDSDQVVGYTYNVGQASPYFWSPGAGGVPLPTPLSAFSTRPSDINNNGLIVGDYIPNNATFNHAYYYDGAYHDLNSLLGNPVASTFAIAANDHGAIAGQTSTAINSVWVYKGGQIIYLNDFVPIRTDQGQIQLLSVIGINDQGQIAVAGVDHGTGSGNDPHVYLFTPVPEPATIVSLLTAVGVLLAAAVRQRGR